MYLSSCRCQCQILLLQILKGIVSLSLHADILKQYHFLLKCPKSNYTSTTSSLFYVTSLLQFPILVETFSTLVSPLHLIQLCHHLIILIFQKFIIFHSIFARQILTQPCIRTCHELLIKNHYRNTFSNFLRNEKGYIITNVIDVKMKT